MKNTLAEIQLVNHTFSNEEDQSIEIYKQNQSFKKILDNKNYTKYYSNKVLIIPKPEEQSNNLILQRNFHQTCIILNLYQKDQITLNKEKVKQLFTQIQFNIRQFDQQTNEHSLSMLVLILMQYYNLYEKMRINQQKLINFIADVENNYNGALYHNRVHAADCVQMSFTLLESLQKNILQQITDCDRLVIILGAACHDINHTGVDTQFLQYENQCLQKLYPKNGQLERIHSIITWQLILKHNFVPEIYLQELGIRISEVILATDMLIHKKYIQILEQLDQNCFIDIQNQPLYKIQAYKWTIIKIIMKLSDISNTIRNLEQTQQWAYAYVNEQRNIGLQKTKFNETISIESLQDVQNYQKNSIAQSQICFITHIMKPFIKEINRLNIFSICQQLQENLNLNLQYWEKY